MYALNLSIFSNYILLQRTYLMRTAQIILIFAIVMTVLGAKPQSKSKDTDPLIHEYIQLALWLILGVIIGVIFEARIQIREVVKPITEKGVTGVIIAGSIYTLFKFASYVSNYLWILYHIFIIQYQTLTLIRIILITAIKTTYYHWGDARV